MARSAPPTIQAASLSPEQMRRGIERLQRRIEELEAFDTQAPRKRFAADVSGLQKAIEETLQRVFGPNTFEFNRYQRAADLDSGPLYYGGGDAAPWEVAQYLTEGKENSLSLLKQAVRGLEEDLADAPPPASETHKSRPSVPTGGREVFVVHGHDEGTREAIARFLEQIDLTPVILHEQASRGQTVIEKVEAHSAVGFAVVLLTPDDVGSSVGGSLNPRARQNVLLELGYFVGRLGRDRVCALRKGDVEIPSDFNGVVYVPLDGSGAWRVALSKELQAAGYIVDWNKVMT